MFVRKQPPIIPPLHDVSTAGDRRRFPRVAVPIFFRAPRFRQVRTPVVDASEGGIRVFMDDPLPVGTVVELELFLPSGEEIVGMARLAWIGALPAGSAAKFDAGFEIFDMAPSARSRLSDAVEGEA